MRTDTPLEPNNTTPNSAGSADSTLSETPLRMHQTLHVCGLNHDRAGLAVRERFALGKERCAETLKRIIEENLSHEALVLSTCNRTEVYAFSSSEEAFSNRLEEFFLSLATQPREETEASRHVPPLYSYEGLEAVRHFFAVCSGLDSMILGENEIKGQIQQAFEMSKELGMAGAHLHRLIEATHRCCKRIKTETELNTGTLSVGRASILQAEQILGSLEGKVCVVIGAGKVGRVAAMAIAERNPARLILINRTVDKAREVGEGLNAEILSIPEMAPAIQQADLILGAAFAPNFLVTRQMFEAVRRQDQKDTLVCLIDTAVPRILDQAIGEIEGVNLIDIAHMEGIVAENRAKRIAAARLAWEIVEEEVEKFKTKIENFSLGPIVERLKKQFDAVYAETQSGFEEMPMEMQKKIQRSQYQLKQKLLHAAISELKNLHLDRKQI